MLADFRQTNLEFVHGVVQRLDLPGELIDLATCVSLLLLQSVLQARERRSDFVDSIGVLLHQVLHHAHALVEAALHGGHLLLQLLDLRLQLNHFLIDAPGRHPSHPEHRQQGEKRRNAL